MTTHKFGGVWTEIKLNVLRDYLNFYTSALKNQHFSLIYIDAFAGTGTCDITVPGKNNDKEIKTIDGSAKIALETSPAFRTYHFIESDNKHHSLLADLCASYKSSDISINLHNGDANHELEKIIDGINWRKNRAVLFLDPYGLEVSWKMIEKIATTKGIDLWFLFSISGLYRQAANNYESVDKHKKAAITRILGTEEWKEAFYETSGQGDFFTEEPKKTRVADVSDLLRFVKDRLKNVFPHVEEPLNLPFNGPPMYALYFAVSNPAAIKLSTKAAGHILNKQSR